MSPAGTVALTPKSSLTGMNGVQAATPAPTSRAADRIRTIAPRCMAASVPAAAPRCNHRAREQIRVLGKRVRPGGDAGLVRPTYPELALGGTTLGAKGVNIRARESDPHAAISARAPATIAPCHR